MAKIVVSYRRNDTKWIVGRICEHLERHFGDGNVFMDVDNIPLGQDYRDHIREVLAKCEVLIAVVGPKWQKIERSGNRSTDDSLDWVRFEISTALERNIPVVPLLIDRAKMPNASQLPDDLRDFAFRQFFVLDTEDFKNQMQRFATSLDRLTAAPAGPPLPSQPLTSRTQQKSDANVNSDKYDLERLGFAAKFALLLMISVGLAAVMFVLSRWTGFFTYVSLETTVKQIVVWLALAFTVGMIIFIKPEEK
jgi:TIR domain